MFEAVELGRKVGKEEFKAAALALRMRLLALQRQLHGSDVPVIVIVSGVEGAGKSEVVNRFAEWLDTRGLQTHTFWDETDDERNHPHYWRFWRRLPPRGTIGLLFGSWYTQPIIDRAFGRTDDAAFDESLHRIATFERLLADDGALIVKLWFHISESVQAQRVKRANARAEAFANARKKGKSLEGKGKRWKISPLAKRFSRRYEEFLALSERAIRRTDTGVAPWHIMDAENRNYRDLAAGQALADALEERLARAERAPRSANAPEPPREPQIGRQLTILSRVDLDRRLGLKKYHGELNDLQRRYYELTWTAWEERRASVILFEGWDAAGKGGAIRRLTSAMDARLYRTVPIAGPTDEERAQHYLWRFWRHLPPDGKVRIYDRSWYGRVLVERVEGFASHDEWLRAYGEINDFEEQLAQHGIVLTKFWIHLSPDEQLRRFEQRQATPHKQHKITDEDWRNREKWDAYEEAVNDMVTRTSTSFSPWTIVPGNDKRVARVEVLRAAVDRLGQALADV